MGIDNASFSYQRINLAPLSSIFMSVNDGCGELWAVYAQNKTLETRNKLFQHYSVWLRKVVSSQYLKNRNTLIDWHDCIQNASIALIESIDRFDFTRGIPFEAFAHPRVKGAIIDGFSEIRSEAYVYADVGAIEQYDFFANRELTGDIDESFDDFIDIVLDVAFSKLLGVSAPKLTEEQNPLNVFLSHTEDKKVHQAIQLLAPNHQFIILSHYHSYLTFTQIAIQLGITKSRVSQLHKDALKKLRILYEKL
jgi:RNA polymerase sigma factor FliA